MTMESGRCCQADNYDLLREIEFRTTRTIAAGRDVSGVGAFLASLHPKSDVSWLNFAVPRPQCAASLSRDDVYELQSRFREDGRVLRIEYFEALWPNLGRLLEFCGLTLEGRLPVMVCTPVGFKPFVASNVVVRDLTPDAPDERISGFIQATRCGFGLDPAQVGPGEISEQREYMEAEIFLCAYADCDGEIAGVGSLSVFNDELAGITTLPGFRRRGVAATLSSHLVQLHFNMGRPYVWLSARDEAARCLYDKVGFQAIGVQLNYVDRGSGA